MMVKRSDEVKRMLIRQYVVETDIHPFVTGTTLENVWANKVEDVYGDTPVFYAGSTCSISRGAATCRLAQRKANNDRGLRPGLRHPLGVVARVR